MSKFRLRRMGLADDPGHFRPSLQGCLEAVLEQSDALVNEVLEGLQAALSPTPGQKGAAVPDARARAAITALDAAQMRQVFATELRSAVFGGDRLRRTAQGPVKFDDFQFLDAEQLDANIEFALTQQEVMRAVEDVLPTLNAMVSNLLGWASVQAHLNPLKPEAFVHALRESLSQQLPDDAARTPVMTLAAGKLGVSLHQLYREIADWLRSQGVEPVHVAKPGAIGLGGAAKPIESSVSRTMLTLEKLRRLLTGEFDTGSVSGGMRDFSHTVPASFEALQDMKLVEPMMKRLAQRASQSENSASAPAKPVDMLAHEQQQSQTRKLGRQLGEEVVRLMLDNLMQDQRLLPKVRDSLKALEPVLVRLANADPRFFSERQHAARQFLERLTHRSLAFSSHDDPGFPRFHKAIDNAVSVLTGGEGDTASFARVLRKLEEGWSRQEEGQRARAEEAARNLLHAEQRNLLAQRLASQYTERLLRQQVPDMVLAFLRGPWAQVVAEAQLKFADGSVDPFGFQSLVDDLIWSVQLQLARRNRARLVQMVPGMLVKMRQGLHLISYPEERMGVFFDELITFHEKVFEGVKPAAVDVESELAASPADAPDAPEAAAQSPEPWVAASEATDSGYLQGDQDLSLDFTQELAASEVPQFVWSMDKLNTGSWVDLALGGAWVRAQLTWASPHRTLFMFISSAGMAHSMSRRTLERLKAQGLIRLFSDGHVMDNALDGVAQAALQNDLRQDQRLKPE